MKGELTIWDLETARRALDLRGCLWWVPLQRLQMASTLFAAGRRLVGYALHEQTPGFYLDGHGGNVNAVVVTGSGKQAISACLRPLRKTLGPADQKRSWPTLL